jgi:hypothetical protein
MDLVQTVRKQGSRYALSALCTPSLHPAPC